MSHSRSHSRGQSGSAYIIVLLALTVLTVIGLKARAGRYSVEYFVPVELAGLYWHLGERDRAFALMLQAFEEHSVLVWSYPIWVPGMSGFADDPRWDRLLASAGLSELRRVGGLAVGRLGGLAEL